MVTLFGNAAYHCTLSVYRCHRYPIFVCHSLTLNRWYAVKVLWWLREVARNLLLMRKENLYATFPLH